MKFIILILIIGFTYDLISFMWGKKLLNRGHKCENSIKKYRGFHHNDVNPYIYYSSVYFPNYALIVTKDKFTTYSSLLNHSK